MVKLVDAVDSKSTGLLAHAGSIPAFGTITCKEKLGKIAIRQYSMISKAICALLLFSYQACKSADHKQTHRDIFKALLTLKVNPEPVEV